MKLEALIYFTSYKRIAGPKCVLYGGSTVCVIYAEVIVDEPTEGGM